MQFLSVCLTGNALVGNRSEEVVLDRSSNVVPRRGLMDGASGGSLVRGSGSYSGCFRTGPLFPPGSVRHIFNS